MREDVTDIVYQYAAGPAVWDELRYSVRSLYKYWRGPIRLWVCGDRPKCLHEDAYTYIPARRGGHPHLVQDQVKKLQRICGQEGMGAQFVLMYDDQYLLKPTGVADLDRWYAVSEVGPKWDASGAHRRAIGDTAKALRLSGYSGAVWNAETHLPRVYNRVKLGAILKAYSALDRALKPATLYYNLVYQGQRPQLLHREDGVKLELHGRHTQWGWPPATDLRPLWGQYHVLNHNNTGLSPQLKGLIAGEFPDAVAGVEV